MYCIVDLETTGGKGNKITEIAMIKFDGEKIVDEFTSLVNPECSIPPFITQLTGITNEMVEDAPKFYEIAKQVVEFLDKDVFVAHNVFFDFNVLKSEFKELGYDFKVEKLCTVKLARATFPGHASYSLGRICYDLGISIQDRHRAMGDAQATVKLLTRILETRQDKDLANETIKERKLLLPAKLDPLLIENAPEKTGVYYLRDEEGRILYVGKSVNIKKRLQQHFRLDLKRQRDVELKNSVASIDYEVTGHELAALVLEASEIKKTRPPFNRALNRVRFRYALSVKENGGFLELKVTTHLQDQTNQALHFRSRKIVEGVIARVYEELFALDYRSGTFKEEVAKWQKILGPESFNQRIENWLLTHEYAASNETLCYYRGKQQLELVIQNSRLVKLHVSAEDERQSVAVEEDPDIKRLILSYLKQKNYLPREYESEFRFD